MEGGPQRRHPRLGFVVWLLSFILATLLITALTSALWLPALGHALEAPSDPAPADAIVVLAGGRLRVRTGVTLYKQGFAPELWHTGDTPQVEDPSPADAQYARRVAIRMGVPASAIHLLTSSTTWEDAQQIAAYARQRGTKSILLVTSWYHSRRALCMVRHHLNGSGVRISFQSAYDTPFGPDDWWHSEEGFLDVVGEYLKTGFYWALYGLTPWQC